MPRTKFFTPAMPGLALALVQLLLSTPPAQASDPEVILPGVLRANVTRQLATGSGIGASLEMSIPEFGTAWEIGAGKSDGKTLVKLEARRLSTTGLIFGAGLNATPASIRTPIELGVRLPFREGTLDLSIEPWAMHRDRQTGASGRDHGIKILGTQALGNLVEIEGLLRASLLSLSDPAGGEIQGGRSVAASLQGRLRLGERWALQGQASYEGRSYKLIRDDLESRIQGNDTRLAVGASVRIGKTHQAR